MLFLLIAVLLGQSAQLPPRDAASSRPATGSIRGRITDRDSGQPIPGALVALRRGGDSQTIIAGADGRYEFTALPGGSYFVAATGGFERATHLTHVFGDPRPIEAAQALVGKTFVLNDGEIRNDVDISLVRALAIDGRVVDPDGEPMAGVEVTASAMDRSVWQPVSGTTDDRGMFRLYGLPAAAYRLCADPRRGGMDAHLLTDRTERLVKTCVPEDGNGQPVVVSGPSAPHV